MQQLAIFFLVAVAMGGVAWVFVYPSLSGETKIEKRKELVARSTAPLPLRTARTPPKIAPRAGRGHAQGDRGAQRQGQIRPAQRQDRAGRTDLVEAALLHHCDRARRRRHSFSCSAQSATCCSALGLAFAAGGGLPFWMLKFLKKRREAKFLQAFPDAVDTIVRGIKAGLPLLDSLRVITAEAPEPLRSEFRAIVETQTVGIPIGEACAKLYERIPLPEANFFGIVIAIQQKSGGNLSEALGNLSKVLRERKKMKAKIQAMSMEAKASAAIIGALPPAVAALVYITSPQYIELLWTHPTGRMMLAGCARLDVHRRAWSCAR